MKTIITYLSLYVIFSVGKGFCDKESSLPNTLQIFGALTALFAVVFAYIYALYNLYQIWVR